MMSITDLLVNQHVYPGQVFKIILCLLPRVIIFSMPAACLMCVLLAFIRLSSDNEIIALNSSGISLYQMLPPVIFFSVISLLFASLIAIYAVPWGNRSYRDVIYRIIKSKADVAIKERIFYEPFDNVVFYVNSFSPKQKIMTDLFVVDRRDKQATNTIIAEKGRILSSRDSNLITIHFLNGTIFSVGKDLETARTIKFETYDFNIDLRDIMSWIISREKEPKEMYPWELIHSLKTAPPEEFKSTLMEIRLFEMFSIPLAIFLMCLIGAPLGTHVRAKGRTKGIVISLLIFLVYYIFLMSVRYISEMGTLSPSIGTWIPDLLLLIICFYLLALAPNRGPIRLLENIFPRDQFKKQPYALEINNQKAVQSDPARYLGSLNGNRFHRYDCKWTNRISRANKITFSSTKEALKKGYHPCKTCNPQ